MTASPSRGAIVRERNSVTITKEEVEREKHGEELDDEKAEGRSGAPGVAHFRSFDAAIVQ